MSLHPQSLCELTSLHYEKSDNTYWGSLQGYPVFLTVVPRRDTVVFRLIAKVPSADAANALPAQASAWSTEHTGVTGLVHKDRCLSAVVSLTPKKTEENLSAVTAALVSFAAAQGLIPCCMSCGTETGYRPYLLDQGGVTVCDACKPHLEEKIREAEATAAAAKPNNIGLIAGIIISAAAVFLLTFFVLKLCYLSMLTGYAGVLLGLFVMRKLGRKLTKPAVIACTVLCLLAGFAAPILHFAALFAETNQQNYDKAKQACDSYLALTEMYDQLTEEERAELDAANGIDAGQYQEIYENAKLITDHTTTASCLKAMPKLLNSSYYSAAKPELIKHLLFTMLSVLACIALTAPPMLRADHGRHTLRELSS